jgi:hypothetical protein
VWDFGDNTAPINATGIKNAQRQNHTFTTHGGFNVTVTATNSVGQTSTKVVVQVIGKLFNPAGSARLAKLRFRIQISLKSKCNFKI